MISRDITVELCERQENKICDTVPWRNNDGKKSSKKMKKMRKKKKYITDSRYDNRIWTR